MKLKTKTDVAPKKSQEFVESVLGKKMSLWWEEFVRQVIGAFKSGLNE